MRVLYCSHSLNAIACLITIALFLWELEPDYGRKLREEYDF